MVRRDVRASGYAAHQETRRTARPAIGVNGDHARGAGTAVEARKDRGIGPHFGAWIVVGHVVPERHAAQHDRGSITRPVHDCDLVHDR